MASRRLSSTAWRLLAALCVSLLLHALPLGAWLTWYQDASLNTQAAHSKALPTESGRSYSVVLASGPSSGGTSDQAKLSGSPEQTAPAESQGLFALPEFLRPRYFRASELDIRPQPRFHVEPKFPLVVDPGTRGTVVTHLFLNEAGEVVSVVPIRADPPGLFEQAVIEAFQSARYTPGMKGGKAVKARLTIEVEFISTALR